MHEIGIIFIILLLFSPTSKTITLFGGSEILFESNEQNDQLMLRYYSYTYRAMVLMIITSVLMVNDGPRHDPDMTSAVNKPTATRIRRIQ